MEMGASFRIEGDSPRRNRRDLRRQKTMQKMQIIQNMELVPPSGHSWMPLGSIPGHPDASR